MKTRGFLNAFDDVWMREGVRTPMVALARELQRYGISRACVGGGQGIALLLENPQAVH